MRNVVRFWVAVLVAAAVGVPRATSLEVSDAPAPAETAPAETALRMAAADAPHGRDERGRLGAESLSAVGRGRSAARKPPEVGVERIAYRNGKLHVRARIEDRSDRLRLRVVIRGRDGRMVRKRLRARTGRVRLSVPVRRERRWLRAGSYEARVIAVDNSGKEGRSAWRPWVLREPGPARVISRLRGAGRRVALTFDDCLYGDAWDRILRTLKRAGATASFFCPGQVLQRFPQQVRRSFRAGHSFGSHGWDHADLTRLGRKVIRRRLLADQRALWRTTKGTTAPYLRPPFGKFDAPVLREAGRTGHTKIIMWDVDPRDWAGTPSAHIARRVLAEARPGSIVVMHVRGNTAGALPAILKGLNKRNLKAVSLDAMFAAARAD